MILIVAVLSDFSLSIFVVSILLLYSFLCVRRRLTGEVPAAVSWTDEWVEVSFLALDLDRMAKHIVNNIGLYTLTFFEST